MSLASWLAERSGPGGTAWLALRREHADRRRFWNDAVLALGAAEPALTALASPPAGALEPFLGALLEGLEQLEEPLVLVLDDLHTVSSPATLGDLDWLLEAAPPALRLVLATRSDPALRLQRLRAAGRLTEVRAADLALTLDETAELLGGLDIATADLERLWLRTEGWATGVKLARLSLERRDDRHAFIEGFAGADAAVSDYLSAEVLACEPPALLDFLLRTCVADALCGELAEALTGESAASWTLHELARANAFMSEVDGRPGWYRYHGLFADVLRAQLHRRMPGEEAALHRRAAGWHSAEGEPLEALRHALAAADWELAAHVLGEHWLAALVRGHGAALLELAREIPPEVLRGDAELALAAAGLELEGGDLNTADELLVWAYDGAGRLPAERRRRFAVASTAASLYRARLSGDVTEALSAAREVLGEHWDRRLAPDVRALTLANLGIAEFWGGTSRRPASVSSRPPGSRSSAATTSCCSWPSATRRRLDARDGRLGRAPRGARALRSSSPSGAAGRGSPTRRSPTPRSAPSRLWRNDLPEAERYAAAPCETLERSAEPLLGAAVAQLRARLLILSRRAAGRAGRAARGTANGGCRRSWASHRADRGGPLARRSGEPGRSREWLVELRDEANARTP